MMHHRRLIDSFPTFSNENLKYQIRSDTNDKFLYSIPTWIGGTGLVANDSTDHLHGWSNSSNSDYQQWWFNFSTSQLFASGKLGTFCLDASLEGTGLVGSAVCNGTSETQKWTYDGDHIVSYNNTCLSVQNGSVNLRTCGNVTSQEWSLYFPQGLPSDTIYGIQNNETRCIDVGGSDFRVGPVLRMYTCITGSTYQQFWRPGSDLRIQTLTGLCIDWYNRTDVWLNNCSDATSQKWTYESTYIKSVLDPTFCLSTVILNHGQSLIGSTCTADPSMQWKTYTNTTTWVKSFSIQSKYSQMCIDVPNSQFNNSQPLQMWECNDTPAQVFWRSDSSDLRLHSSNGKCIDWYQKQSIILNDCQESSGQKWIFDGNSFSSLANLNICLSYENTLISRGAELTVSGCNFDQQRTQWTPFSDGFRATLDHSGGFSGFNFDMFRCPNNTMVTSAATSYDLDREVILTLNMSCEDGSTKSFGKMNIPSSTSIVPIIAPSCRGGFAAVQGVDSLKNLVCATIPISSPNGFSYCPHSNTSLQRVIGANIWYSSEQFYGMEPVCDNILGNYGGDFFTFQCPPGSYLSKIGGTGNARVTSLTVSCATGLDSNLTAYGWSYHVGSKSETIVDNDWCSTSIHGITIWFDVEDALYGLLPLCNGTMTQKIIGVEGGNEKKYFRCPLGTSLVGIRGLADKSYVYRLSFICGDTPPPSNAFSFKCQSGKRIVRLSSTGNPFIQQIQPECDDGNVSASLSGPGVSNTGYCSRGFTSAKMIYGENIGQISLFCNGTGYGKSLGTATLGNKTEFSCPNGQAITGIKGTKRTALEGLFFECQQVPIINQTRVSSSDLAAIGYGWITGFVILGILSFVVWFILHRRHKERFLKHDDILPLR